MTREEIVSAINSVFEDAFEIDPERLLPEANIFQDLGLDSLDTVDLVVAIQKKFGVQIRDDERIRNIRTLGDVYQFIEVIYNEKKA